MGTRCLFAEMFKQGRVNQQPLSLVLRLSRLVASRESLSPSECDMRITGTVYLAPVVRVVGIIGFETLGTVYLIPIGNSLDGWSRF